jgi:ligand-binding sensor domain-containing protein/serine phosphatase RsbU (regulator of sigma subunit)
MRFIFVFISLLLLCYTVPVSGQINISDYRLFSVLDGLSQSTVKAILQDSRGYLWIGTEDGLNRYDGYEFIGYSHQPNDSNSLSNNYINAICEGKNGLLWIATNYGLNCINLKTGQLKTYFYDANNPNSLSDNCVLNVYVDKQKTLWIKTLKSLDKFDPENETFKRYAHYNDIFYYTTSNISFPVIEDLNGRMWVGTKDGLNFFDRDLQLFKRYVSLGFNANSLSDNEIRCLIKDKNSIWIGTSRGLNRFDNEKKEFKRFYVDATNALIAKNKINAMFLGEDSIIWVGTSNGLYFFNTQTGIFQQPQTDKIELKTNAILSIARDNSGIFWVGTSKGLIKLNTCKSKFKVFNAKTQGLKLKSYDIGCLLSTDNNSFLIGTLGEGLYYYNSQIKTIKEFDFAKNGIARNNYIYAIYPVYANNYLVGTENGLVLFNFLNGSFSNLCENTKISGCEMLFQNRVNGITKDINGLFWIATSYGLYSYNREKNAIVGYFNNSGDKNSICNNRINVLLPDNSGKIWVGTENGLDYLDPVKKIFKHFRTNSNGKQLLSSNSIYCLKLDSQESLWIGTAAGLNKFKKAENQVKMITEKDGLTDNSIYSIEIDYNDIIWISTNRGINKIDPETYKITNYDIFDGLQDYEFNRNSSCKSQSGELCFGGISGFNVFNPDSLKSNKYVPPVAITSVEIITSNERLYLQNTSQNQITIPYRTKVFTINFASLDFTMPNKNSYAYKIYSDNAMESDWIYIGKKHSASFTNLKPGRYVFKLKGSNNDDVWNETGVGIELVVESPFWLKPQAVYIYIFLGILLLLAVFRFRTYNLLKTNRILKEKEVASHEVELQRQQLAIKNKNITDSINYAKRIQEALMPSEKSVKRILPEFFVLHQPKDIVSGDFFWVSERGDKIFLAAVDCTGHGVPGAFMSIIGFELFRKITHNQGIENPSQILTILNREFEEIFKDVENYIMRDGMDIAFCVINKKTKLLEYSGAVNPIYLIRDDKITEIVGSRFSVGIDNTPEEERGFENKQIILQDDDIIYLFSDGYADQFGGTDGKKFKYRRFRHLLLTIHKYPLEEQQSLLRDRINRWKGDLDQVDDILIMGFKPVFNS